MQDGGVCTSAIELSLLFHTFSLLACAPLHPLASSSLLQCHQLLAGLSRWGADVRHWLHNGCYRVEPYGSMSLVQPCPSHVICSKITDLESKSFCAEVMTDFTGTAPE